MKLNILDAHDRFQIFSKQKFDISECCQNLIDQRPFGNYPFYIFAHARTEDDGSSKRLIWQPRLTKPRSQTNSMLFKAYPGTDKIKVIWMIPDRALWKQYRKGNLTENKTISDSIHDFQFNRDKLDASEDDDLSDDQIALIYTNMAADMSNKKLMDRIYK